MPQSSTIIVVPLIGAILTFVIVFYRWERAYSIKSHNFISAVAAMLFLASYLVLRVVDAMSYTLTLVYAAVAVAFAIWAFICTRI
jgi:hypothetical protein